MDAILTLFYLVFLAHFQVSIAYEQGKTSFFSFILFISSPDLYVYSMHAFVHLYDMSECAVPQEQDKTCVTVILNL